MQKDIFSSGSFRGNGLAEYAMGKPTEMLESLRQDPPPPGNDPLLESRDGGKGLTVELAQEALLEAAKKQVNTGLLEDAAEAVIEWANGSDKSFEALDGYALALAGVSEDDEEDDITDAQVDDYNASWANFANFMVAVGVDEEDISSVCDDADDDAAASVANTIAELSEEEQDELIFAFSAGGDEAMNEAVVKVVRNGKVVLKRKPVRPRRLNAAQRAALKKARRKANTAGAKIARRKSMKLRAKRIS